MTLEFSAVRASVAQAVKQAERARQLRIESIDRQLPALESDITTKQQAVAALRAERERLQAQTGAQIVAGMVGEGGEKREQKQDEPFLLGLPDKRLRDVWAEWEDDEGYVVTFKGDEYRWSAWSPTAVDLRIAEHQFAEISLRPHGATWEHVKRLADAAEKKEAGPLKVGDRVEVPEGVRSAVSGGSVLPGTYQVMHDYSDGDVLIDNGIAVFVVRASDVRRV